MNTSITINLNTLLLFLIGAGLLYYLLQQNKKVPLEDEEPIVLYEGPVVAHTWPGYLPNYYYDHHYYNDHHYNRHYNHHYNDYKKPYKNEGEVNQNTNVVVNNGTTNGGTTNGGTTNGGTTNETTTNETTNGNLVEPDPEPTTDPVIEAFERVNY